LRSIRKPKRRKKEEKRSLRRHRRNRYEKKQKEGQKLKSPHFTEFIKAQSTLNQSE
jgi:hypothetical protein